MNPQASTEILNRLMTEAPSEKVGRQLLNWARDLQGRIARGDMMIGILSVDEAERLPAILTKAAGCGLGEAGSN